jgi:hypothetical protein
MDYRVRCTVTNVSTRWQEGCTHAGVRACAGGRARARARGTYHRLPYRRKIGTVPAVRCVKLDKPVAGPLRIGWIMPHAFEHAAVELDLGGWPLVRVAGMHPGFLSAYTRREIHVHGRGGGGETTTTTTTTTNLKNTNIRRKKKSSQNKRIHHTDHLLRQPWRARRTLDCRLCVPYHPCRWTGGRPGSSAPARTPSWLAPDPPAANPQADTFAPRLQLENKTRRLLWSILNMVLVPAARMCACACMCGCR